MSDIGKEENVDVTLLIGFHSSAVGDLENVMRVVQATGVDPVDFDGRSFLHIACCKGQSTIVEFLIDPIEILAVVVGTQQALDSALLAGASLKTGIESKV